MSNPILKAKVIATGEIIEVYKLAAGGFAIINQPIGRTCTETFTAEQLKLL